MTQIGLPRTLMDLLSSSRYRVDGNSMSPTLASGEYVLASSLDLPWNHPSRSRIVVLRHPAQHHRIYIKRIVGLPDESISLRNGVVYIGDLPLQEAYLTGSPKLRKTADREWWTGPSEYFVMGDNRNDSEDSRVFGPVSRELILGSVWLRYWPLRAWGKVPADAGQAPLLDA